MRRILLVFLSSLMLLAAAFPVYAEENGTTIQVHAVNDEHKKIYNVTVPTSLAMVVYTSDSGPHVLVGSGAGVESAGEEGQGVLIFQNASIKTDADTVSSLDLKITKAVIEKNGILWRIIGHDETLTGTDQYAYRMQLRLGADWVLPDVGGGGSEAMDALLKGPIVTALHKTTYPAKVTRLPVEVAVGGSNESYTSDLGKGAAGAFTVEWEISEAN